MHVAFGISSAGCLGQHPQASAAAASAVRLSHARWRCHTVQRSISNHLGAEGERAKLATGHHQGTTHGTGTGTARRDAATGSSVLPREQPIPRRGLPHPDLHGDSPTAPPRSYKSPAPPPHDPLAAPPPPLCSPARSSPPRGDWRGERLPCPAVPDPPSAPATPAAARAGPGALGLVRFSVDAAAGPRPQPPLPRLLPLPPRRRGRLNARTPHANQHTKTPKILFVSSRALLEQKLSERTEQRKTPKGSSRWTPPWWPLRTVSGRDPPRIADPLVCCVSRRVLLGSGNPGRTFGGRTGREWLCNAI
jgi:hypothetical protein